MGVEILHSKPPIFDKCEKVFGISWNNTIFAYYPFIHSKFDVTDDIIEHELVHMQQQKEFGNVENWWEAYFDYPQVRLDWELEAYIVQYKFLKHKNTINREELFKKVHFWASSLSGKTYGYLIGLDEAIDLITHG